MVGRMTVDRVVDDLPGLVPLVSEDAVFRVGEDVVISNDHAIAVRTICGKDAVVSARDGDPFDGDIIGVNQFKRIASGSRICTVELNVRSDRCLDRDSLMPGIEHDIIQQRVVAGVNVNHVAGLELVSGKQRG